MPAAASLGTFLLTLIAEVDGAAATATALKSSEINMADQQGTSLDGSMGVKRVKSIHFS